MYIIARCVDVDKQPKTKLLLKMNLGGVISLLTGESQIITLIIDLTQV